MDLERLLVERDKDYLNFHPDIRERADIRAVIESDPGRLDREGAVSAALDNWWTANRRVLEALPGSQEVMAARTRLLDGFHDALVPVGVLDRYQVAGIVASWWDANAADLRTLEARGFEGVVDSWVVSLLDALEDDKDKSDPLEHKLVRRLLPEYLEELEQLEARKAELEAEIKAATPAEDDEEAAEANDGEGPSEEELKALKDELKGVRARIKKQRKSLVDRLQWAKAELSAEDCRGLVLELMRKDLESALGQYVGDHLREVVGVFESWWDKYRVTLREIEGARNEADFELNDFLRDLGYSKEQA